LSRCVGGGGCVGGEREGGGVGGGVWVWVRVC